MVHAVSSQMCGVLPTTRYQATDTAISREIRSRLDAAIRTGVPPDPRTAALAALAHAVGLGKHLYPGNEGRSCRSRLRDLIRHDPMGGLVAHAVMDVQNGAGTQQPRRQAANNGAAGTPAAPTAQGGRPTTARAGVPSGRVQSRQVSEKAKAKARPGGMVRAGAR